jgi:metallo-beta-lactamase class B
LLPILARLRCHPVNNGRGLNLVCADSLTAISDDGFRFTDNPRDKTALSDFKKSLATLAAVPCDILLTPHPGASDMRGKLERRQRGEVPDPF